MVAVPRKPDRSPSLYARLFAKAEVTSTVVPTTRLLWEATTAEQLERMEAQRTLFGEAILAYKSLADQLDATDDLDPLLQEADTHIDHGAYNEAEVVFLRLRDQLREWIGRKAEPLVGGRLPGATNLLTRRIERYLDTHPRATRADLLAYLQKATTTRRHIDPVLQEVVELPTGDYKINWVDRRGAEKSTLFSTIVDRFRARLRPE
jgi:hypothetical protein